MPAPIRKQPRRFARTPLALAMLMVSPALLAQAQIEEIVVTSQKRAQNMQDVPVSITAFDTKSLDQLNISGFDEYSKLLPSLQSQQSAAGIGFTNVYFRGVATGGDGQATLSQPSVGSYLDEMPITTVQGNLDIHVYDVARIEALAGPQGTLYGASSQSGTIRIITNKPDPSGFAASYTLEANTVTDGGEGYSGEAYVNIPLSESAAVRIVGWKRKDAGYIDNVLRSRTFPGDQSTTDDDITVNNAAFVEDDYNTIGTEGARAALRVDLNEDWTVTGTLMAQEQAANGTFGEDLSGYGGSQGDRTVSHIQPEFVDDHFYMASMTVEGKVGMFDVTYAGAYLNRNLNSSFDYTDYSYFYDVAYTSGYFAGLHFDDAGNRIWPGARFGNNDNYDRKTHELRISTPEDYRVRGLFGAYMMDSVHNFEQKWLVDGLAKSMEPNANSTVDFTDIVYLNNMDRDDQDEAFFGRIEWDIIDSLTLTGGVRHFKATTDIVGFFGYGLGFNRNRAPGENADGTPRPGEENEPGNVNNGGEGAFDPNGAGWSGNGEWRCPSQADYKDTPCKNVDKGISESGEVYSVNLSWTIAEGKMVYGTWSEGYRPGGINRNPFAPNFESDFLTNKELGWKTQWFDGSVQWNGALFWEKWEEFQVGFQGANGITQNVNGPTAKMKGIETDVLWAATENLQIGASGAYIDTEVKEDYCPGCQAPRDLNGDGDMNDSGESANWNDAGANLPYTADFKGNIIARYTFPVGSFEGHLQGSLAYEGKRSLTLNERDRILYQPDAPSNTYVNVAAGIAKDSYEIELFAKNLTDEDATQFTTSQCAPAVCGGQNYGVIARPRTIGLRWTQTF